MGAEARIKELGLALPVAPKPVANYVPAVRSGSLLFLSGVIPSRDGKLVLEGKLGRDLTIEQGYEAAKIATLNALANIKQALGTLDRVTRILRVVGHVASHEGFVQHPAVINGASDLLVAVFGEIGRHSRVALGAAELPMNAPVEIELIVEVQS